jgi:hypothetical protein
MDVKPLAKAGLLRTLCNLFVTFLPTDHQTTRIIQITCVQTTITSFFNRARLDENQMTNKLRATKSQASPGQSKLFTCFQMAVKPLTNAGLLRTLCILFVTYLPVDHQTPRII